MVFVDGENLAMRAESLRKSRGDVWQDGVVHVPDTLVWSIHVGYGGSDNPFSSVRRYYYTSSRGDEAARIDAEKKLKGVGIQAPRVFHRPKGGRSKRVDISLATDMLLHASRKHYDIGVLVTGDGDYVPLVQAVQGEGAVVALWYVQDGVSDALVHAADHAWDISHDLMTRPRKKGAT